MEKRTKIDVKLDLLHNAESIIFVQEFSVLFCAIDLLNGWLATDWLSDARWPSLHYRWWLSCRNRELSLSYSIATHRLMDNKRRSQCECGKDKKEKTIHVDRLFCCKRVRSVTSCLSGQGSI